MARDPLTPDAPGRPPLAVAALLVGLLALVWGCNWPMMKVALAEVDIWVFRASCTAFAGLLFLAVLTLRGTRLAVPRAERRPLALTALFNMTLWPLLSSLALVYYPAGPSGIVAYTMPLWVAALGALWLGERLTGRRLAALASGMAGLLVLVWPDLERQGAPPFGAVVMLTGSLIWAVGVILQKRTRWTAPTAVLVAWQMVLGGIPLAAVALVTIDFAALASISPEAALAWLYTMTLGIALGTWLFFRVIALFPVAIAGVNSLAVPVVGVVSSALMLGEPVGLHTVGALALVLAAIALVLFERPAQPRPR